MAEIARAIQESGAVSPGCISLPEIDDGNSASPDDAVGFAADTTSAIETVARADDTAADVSDSAGVCPKTSLGLAFTVPEVSTTGALDTPMTSVESEAEAVKSNDIKAKDDTEATLAATTEATVFTHDAREMKGAEVIASAEPTTKAETEKEEMDATEAEAAQTEKEVMVAAETEGAVKAQTEKKVMVAADSEAAVKAQAEKEEMVAFVAEAAVKAQPTTEDRVAAKAGVAVVSAAEAGKIQAEKESLKSETTVAEEEFFAAPETAGKR
jgi:hypothetical protein